jgi:hypothetical protein
VLYRHGLLAMPVVLLLVSLAYAAPSPLDLQAELGFGGWIVPGAWTPLRVEITTREAIDGELVVGTGAASGQQSLWRHPLQLSAGARQRIDLDVIIGDPRRPVVLSVHRRGVTLVSTRMMTTALRATEGIVIALTDDAAGLEVVASLPRGLRPAYLREAQLPRRWQDYEGVALVVVRDLIDNRLLPAQREALIHWVGQGGRVLVTGGDAQAMRLSWLRDILPAHASGTTRSAVLRTISGTGRPVPILQITPRPTAEVIRDGGMIVSARWYYGRGVTTVWAFDPFVPEARAWPTRRRLWSSVLEIQPRPAASSADVGRVLPISQSLPGRAQGGLALLTVLYVLAVRYAQRRWVPRTGWLGMIAITLVFGSLMYAFAVNARATAVAATQVTVIETLADRIFARAATYVSVANPYGSPYRLRAPEGATLRSLDGVAAIYFRGSNDVAAASSARGLIFESLQIVPQAVRARIVERGGGAELVVRTHPGMSISSPVVFLRGRIHNLPDFTESLSFALDPTKWEGVDGRSGQIRGEIRGQIRSALYARLREMEHLRERPWLIGWVSDSRASVSLSRGHAGPAWQLLVAEVERGP